MIDCKSIGARIRYHRTINKISQEELAFRTQMSRVHIGYIERGERAPSLESVINIANALNVSADELLLGNLLVAESRMSTEELDILNDCSTEECEILLKSMKGLKETIRAYRITK